MPSGLTGHIGLEWMVFLRFSCLDCRSLSYVQVGRVMIPDGSHRCSFILRLIGDKMDHVTIQIEEHGGKGEVKSESETLHVIIKTFDPGQYSNRFVDYLFVFCSTSVYAVT